MRSQYAGEEEIEALVSAFESCSFHPEQFRHYQHLKVALWYVWHYSPVEAQEKVTTGIRRLAETYGKTGYHETITLFWLRMVSNFVAEHKSNSLNATANGLIKEYDNKDLIRQFYSEELLNSPEAKANWLEPDLQTLPTPTDSKTS